MSTIGHNRPPIETADDLPEGLAKLFYVKLDIQALRKALFDKPLDVRGAFTSALLAMYEHMEPLPADDHMAMLRCGIKDLRLWKRVKGEMLSLGLLVRKESGRLSNERFELEIEAYVDQHRKRVAAALEREKKARVARTKTPLTNLVQEKLGDSYRLANAQLTDSYSIANQQLIVSDTEKVNEFNVGTTTAVPQPDHNGAHSYKLELLKKEVNKKEIERSVSHTPEIAAAPVRVCEGARAGEEDIGHGVYAAAKTIRHADFVISIDGVFMQTLNCGLSREEITDVCKGIALQWGLDLEGGKEVRRVVPSNVANFLSVAVRRAASDRAQQGVRMARTARGHDNREQAEQAETRAARMKRLAREVELDQQFNRNRS